VEINSGAQLPFRVAEWLPSDQAFLDKWLAAMSAKSHAEAKDLHPVIADFRDLIEADAGIFMLFSQMFTQVPRRPPYNKDPRGRPQVRDYQHMLRLLNTIMTHAPQFDQTGLVGCPARECRAEAGAERLGALPQLRRFRRRAQRASAQRLVRCGRPEGDAELHARLPLRAGSAPLGISLMGRFLHATIAPGCPPGGAKMTG
jgi:hypothetical protein